MKRIFIFSLLLVCMISISYAQDVIYFNDGSILEGEILEMDPASSLKIKTTDGGTFTVRMSDIDHMAKQGIGTNRPGYSVKRKQIDRHGKELYWVDNGKKLTSQDYDNELKGDLFTTFRGGQKQFSNGNSLLYCGVVLTLASAMFYYSYLNSDPHYNLDPSFTPQLDETKLIGFYVTSIGADACFCLGFIFRGIGKGRMEWVKDTYNNTHSHGMTKIGLSPAVMMTAQRDLGLGATLSLSF